MLIHIILLMHVLVLTNLLICLIFTIFEVAGTPFRTECWRNDLSELLPCGIYDYLKNVSTWLMTESCSNYLNFLQYTLLEKFANIYHF